MKIFIAVLSVLLFSVTSVFAAAGCKPGSCVDQSPAKAKNLRPGNELICFNFRQDQYGKVIFSTVDGRGRTIRSWKTKKGKVGSICIPQGYIKNAKSIIVCGCYTKRWTKGNSWRLNKGTSDRRYFSFKRGGSKRLNLCPPR